LGHTDHKSRDCPYGKKVAGRSGNLKITRPENLALAEFYLEQQQ